jgi:4-hydroxybenzoate polyprenyltransferase
MHIFKMSSLFAPLKREVDIFLGFTWRDWSASIIVGSIHAIGPLRHTRLTIDNILPRIALLLTYLTLYLYFFNLTTQIPNASEDIINKPDRPIPSGLVSLDGAKRRWLIVTSCFIGISAFEPTLFPHILYWMSTSIFLAIANLGNHWLFKNGYSMPAGAWPLLVGASICINPTYPVDLPWMAGLLVWIGLTANIQDLRDIVGDTATNRRTLPVLYGDTGSRLIITFILMPLAVAALKYGGVLTPAPMTAYALHIYLGYCIMRGGGSYADHKTYMVSN